jgi:putative flippase GtrA
LGHGEIFACPLGTAGISTTTLNAVDSLRPGALMELARSHAGQKLIRYGLVSAVGVVITQLTLTVLYKFFGVDAAVSNIAAVSVSSVPCYLLSKRWVWGRDGRSHLLKEVAPFWGFAFAGLVLSTVFVHWVKQHSDSLVWINGSSLAGFGVLWVIRFLVLDRLIWGAHHHTPVDEEIEDELAAESRLGGDDESGAVAPSAMSPNRTSIT